MVNAWSLLYDELYGDDKMTDENRVTPQESDEYDPIKTSTDLVDGITISGLEDGISISTNPDDYEHSQYWYDYNRNDPSMPNPFATDPLADNDDQIAHHIQINTSANLKENMSDSRNKYHEKEILKDVEEYVSRTYNGHYTGTKHEYRNVQTLDLMAARDLASDFCQANILKYGSRYGSKDGKNKKDLMKVIHYAMLLLHFDEHYGKPSMTSGNIDHNMP
tara:strand:+ start:186 stop:845 length:660 start_codon:yes stop_codon:yes gene_type:complete